MHWAVIVAAAFCAIGFVLAARLIPRRVDADAEHRRPAGGV
jgi:hypothetical protein